MILVAIVNATKYLFQENGSVFLSELASGDDLVEELSSLANPTPLDPRHLLSHYVVALLVFEELVHPHDVRVVLQQSVPKPTSSLRMVISLKSIFFSSSSMCDFLSTFTAL